MKLYKHQQKILENNPPKHALVWEVGTGKTLASIELAKKNSPDSVVVICPKGLVTNWTRQVPSNWLVISKETFRRDWDDLDRYEVVICDEVHFFLGTKSQMMKSLQWYFDKWQTPYRWLLSGTVYRSTPMDVFILAKLLDRPLNYWSFRSKYFYDIRMGSRIIPVIKSNIEEDLANLVREYGSVVKLDECVDMPKAIYETEYFSLNKKQIKAIKEIDDVAPIIKYTKYHQICGGVLKGDEYNKLQKFPCDKVDRILEISNDIKQLIVVCRYNAEIDYLKELLEKEHYVKIIRGDVTNRQEILDDLSTKKSYVLLVNAAVSEGWELANCSTIIFYSYSYSLKDKIQMEGRIRRINNPKKVTYISLTTKDSIDEAVKKSLDKKEDFHIQIYSKEN